MVTSTFLNLKADKKARIQAALLAEFSSKPLSQAEVAPIVKQAKIARGAFYKYFDDLTDAYRYILSVAMTEIHQPIVQEIHDDQFDPDFYVKQVNSFISGVTESKYLDLIKMHLQKNESLVEAPRTQEQLSQRQWAAMVLSHDALKRILAAPEEKERWLTGLEDVLSLISNRKGVD